MDNKAAGDVIKAADKSPKDTLDPALNAVAAQTQAARARTRPGSPAAKPSGSPKASPAACAAESLKPSGSPKPSGSAKPSEEGRVTVAERTTLNAGIKTIVDKAIADMAATLKDARAKVGALPSPDHGKPAGDPANANQPSDKPGGRPSETPKR